MAVQIVTCKKCKKVFDYEKNSGICPKCARFYSTTTYNEGEAFLNNIMSSANEENCSYHGSASHTGISHTGHSEGMHITDNKTAVSNNAAVNTWVDSTVNKTVNSGNITPITNVEDNSKRKGGKIFGILFFMYVLLKILSVIIRN